MSDEVAESIATQITEAIYEVRAAVVELREKVDLEGSFVQDRLNEIKKLLADRG